MTKTIYLMRHGRTRANLEKYYGSAEEPLLFEPAAFSEAKAAVAQIDPVGIAASPYLRAMQTAAIVKPDTIARIDEEPLLREVSMGVLEGRRFSDAYDQYGAALDPWIDDPFSNAPPRGESLKDAMVRAEAFLQAAEEGHLYVSHDGIIRLILCAVAGDIRRFFDISVQNLQIVPLDCNEISKR
ncbi:broad specificity phosphatase PhoE [Peptoniphilus ivorii]|uniref:histidine phosphatase family protein n=1 Tax=Aedoeadaptatus ivorii TaxID=54006 RepID=UPI0027865BFF|nr:histidine phosphatase family protein [Peptoniphilus ivorii]MDQ0507710.1 broad specificity phosphatase PhoE [Peptoniphilus ivorii]